MEVTGAAADEIGPSVNTSEGDEEFEIRFTELYLRATRPAARVLGRSAEVEAVAAEALARLYVRRHQLFGFVDVGAWIARVATNLAIDHLRRQRRQLGVQPLGNDPEEQSDRGCWLRMP